MQTKGLWYAPKRSDQKREAALHCLWEMGLWWEVLGNISQVLTVCSALYITCLILKILPFKR